MLFPSSFSLALAEPDYMLISTQIYASDVIILLYDEE
jgi:hypothetical protein